MAARTKTRMEICSPCQCYKSFTLTIRAKLKKGDVCDECKLDPPIKCSVCETPHRLKNDEERCEYCQEEDITKESEYCVLCHKHYKPTESLWYKLVVDRPLEGEVETLVKSLHLCDTCIEKCRKPFPYKPSDNRRPPEPQNVFDYLLPPTPQRI